MKLLSKRIGVAVAMLVAVVQCSSVFGYTNEQQVSEVLLQESNNETTTDAGIMVNAITNTYEKAQTEENIYDLTQSDLVIEEGIVKYGGNESKLEGPIIVTSYGNVANHIINVKDTEDELTIIFQDLHIETNEVPMHVDGKVNLVINGDNYLGTFLSENVIEADCIKLQGSGKLTVKASIDGEAGVFDCGNGIVTNDLEILNATVIVMAGGNRGEGIKGNVTMVSGKLTVTSGKYKWPSVVALQEGGDGITGTVIIQDGEIHAYGGGKGAGIHQLIAYGGSVEANGGTYGMGICSAQINEGKVTATGGESASGINELHMQGGHLIVNSDEFGVGIGGYNQETASQMEVNGGIVEVYGHQYGIGIGRGQLMIAGGNISINSECKSAVNCDKLTMVGGKLYAYANESKNSEIIEEAVDINCKDINIAGGEVQAKYIGFKSQLEDNHIIYTGGIIDSEFINAIVTDEEGDCLNYALVKCNGSYQIRLDGKEYSRAISYIKDDNLILILRPAIYEVRVQDDNEWKNYWLMPNDSSREFDILEQESQLSDVYIDYQKEVIKINSSYNERIEISDSQTFNNLLNDGDSIKAYKGKCIYVRRIQNNKPIGTIKVIYIPSSPAIPQLSIKGISQSEIDINEIANAVYSLDKVNWQKETMFSNLQPDTVYTVYAWIPSTDSSFASEINSIQVETRLKDKYDKPSKDMLQVDYSNEMLIVNKSLKGRLELSGSISFSNPIAIEDEINISSYIGKTIYIREKERRKGDQITVASDPLALSIKDRPSKPIFYMNDIAATEIIIEPIENGEYSLDGITWQKENKFSNLKAGHLYTIYVKKVANDEDFASLISEKVVVTSNNAGKKEVTLINKLTDIRKKVLDFFRFK